MFRRTPIAFLLLAILLTACGGGAASGGGDKLRVVATTTIVGDVVARVGGDCIDLTILLPVGADPHAFDPRPQDVAAVADADIVFANGAGLEEFLHPLLESAGAEEKLVEVSMGIELLPFDAEEKHAGGEEHEGGDPHIWMDPNNVILWTENIAAALSGADPAHAEQYAVNAGHYIEALRELDVWIHTRVARIPPERRKLVSDHAVFGYFAKEYGFEQVGTIVASFSTNASPSARELAELEDTIWAYNIPAIFVGATFNPALAEQVSQDTGTALVFVYTGSLSAPGGEADSYIEFMRYNVNVIVEALK